MLHSFLTITKCIATVMHTSTLPFTLLLKPVLLTEPAPAQPLANYLSASGDSVGGRKIGFISGRVRLSGQRFIIEWQTKRANTAGNFAIYRSRTSIWREARPIDLSIFATADSQPTVTTYRAVDTTALSPGLYYYWIVDLTAKHHEQRYGPYRSAIDTHEQPKE